MSLFHWMIGLLLFILNLEIVLSPRGKPISEYERERIIFHLKRGRTIQDIEYWFGYSSKTIERLIIRHYNQGNTDMLRLKEKIRALVKRERTV